MNLQSPIFDKVRVPSRTVLASIIERICAEHETEVESFRANRHEYPSDEIVAIRREALAAARDAGYSVAAISQWFNHRDSGTVSRWLSDMEATR